MCIFFCLLSLGNIARVLERKGKERGVYTCMFMTDGWNGVRYMILFGGFQLYG